MKNFKCKLFGNKFELVKGRRFIFEQSNPQETPAPAPAPDMDLAVANLGEEFQPIEGSSDLAAVKGIDVEAKAAEAKKRLADAASKAPQTDTGVKAKRVALEGRIDADKAKYDGGQKADINAFQVSVEAGAQEEVVSKGAEKFEKSMEDFFAFDNPGPASLDQVAAAKGQLDQLKNDSKDAVAAAGSILGKWEPLRREREKFADFTLFAKGEYATRKLAEGAKKFKDFSAASLAAADKFAKGLDLKYGSDNKATTAEANKERAKIVTADLGTDFGPVPAPAKDAPAMPAAGATGGIPEKTEAEKKAEKDKKMAEGPGDKLMAEARREYKKAKSAYTGKPEEAYTLSNPKGDGLRQIGEDMAKREKDGKSLPVVDKSEAEKVKGLKNGQYVTIAVGEKDLRVARDDEGYYVFNGEMVATDWETALFVMRTFVADGSSKDKKAAKLP